MQVHNFYNNFNKDISWINDRTIYLVRHGSHAYGVNIESSDEDFKGVCIPPKNYYIGNKNFEQAELNDPDVVIYEFRKFVNLASACNPNILEVLFVNTEDIIYIDSIGETLLNNRDLFLSKRVKHTFSGYAISQLKRMRTHRNFILNPPKKKPVRSDFNLPERTLIAKDQLQAASSAIQKELDKSNLKFIDDLNDSTKIYIKNLISDMMAEMKLSTNDQWFYCARKIGLDDNFIDLMKKEREYLNKKKEWDQYQNWKRNRNPKRYVLEEKNGYDPKNAYHLVRLLKMAREILTTGEVIVKRPDREELIAIRNGAWSYEKLISFAEKEDNSLNELYKTCNVLPNTPNLKKIDSLMISLIEKSLSNYSWYNIRKKLLDIWKKAP